MAGSGVPGWQKWHLACVGGVDRPLFMQSNYIAILCLYRVRCFLYTLKPVADFRIAMLSGRDERASDVISGGRVATEGFFHSFVPVVCAHTLAHTHIVYTPDVVP